MPSSPVFISAISLSTICAGVPTRGIAAPTGGQPHLHALVHFRRQVRSDQAE
jgi:hypothetical protein